MRLFQRVGAALPGRRRTSEPDRGAQAPGSAWAAFAQATEPPAAPVPADLEAPPAEDAPSATPDGAAATDPVSECAAPASDPAPETPDEPAPGEEPSTADPADLDLMSLLPPELRQTVSCGPAPEAKAAATDPADLPAPEARAEPAPALPEPQDDAPVEECSVAGPADDAPAEEGPTPGAAGPAQSGSPPFAPTDSYAGLPDAPPPAGAEAFLARLGALPPELPRVGPDPFGLDPFDDDALADSPPLSQAAEAPRSGLSALLADGFRHLDGSAPARTAPANGSHGPGMSDILAEAFRRPDGLPASQPVPPRAAPDDRSAPPSPGPASGLAAFLADACRHLDAPPPPRGRPEPRPDRPAKREAEAPPARSAQPSLAEAAEISGLIASCLVDSDSGLLLAAEGKGLDHDAAAALTTQVVRAEREAIELLGLDDRIEDILVTTSRQLHVIRPLERTPAVFVYLALDRKAANLGMARIQLGRIEGGLAL